MRPHQADSVKPAPRECLGLCCPQRGLGEVQSLLLFSKGRHSLWCLLGTQPPRLRHPSIPRSAGICQVKGMLTMPSHVLPGLPSCGSLPTEQLPVYTALSRNPWGWYRQQASTTQVERLAWHGTGPHACGSSENPDLVASGWLSAGSLFCLVLTVFKGTDDKSHQFSKPVWKE